MQAKKNPSLFAKKEDFCSRDYCAKDLYQLEEEQYSCDGFDNDHNEMHDQKIEDIMHNKNQDKTQNQKKFEELEQLSFWHNPFPSLSCMEDLSNRTNIIKLGGIVIGLCIATVVLWASVKYLIESSGGDEPIIVKAPPIPYKIKPEIEQKDETLVNPIYERIEHVKAKKQVKEKIVEDNRAVPIKQAANCEDVAYKASFYIILGEFETHHAAGKYWENLQNVHYKALKNCDPIVKIETGANGKKIYQLLTGPLSQKEAGEKCKAIGRARLLSITD